MESANTSAEALRAQIAATEAQLQSLKDQLAKIEEKEVQNGVDPVTHSQWPLSQEEYKRYGRQMIVPNIGIQGQLRLKNSKVLIIGAGGLGCPAAAYLAGAGVGTLGIVDGDVIETSNLHRQILHSTSKVGTLKVDSAISYLRSLNPNTTYNAHPEHISPQNASSIISPYDLILDCTDNPASRYLISDTCILLSKPLISASALRTEGQLILLNTPPLPAGNEKGGPCYRCVFPKPPPPESVLSCGDGGIVGPVVGVMGVLQAVEGIKLITQGRLGAPEAKEGEETKTEPNTMLLFSANSSPQFRSLKMRTRRPGCFACSSDAKLTLESLSSGSLDYVLFCGLNSPVNVLKEEERIEAKEYERTKKGTYHLLVDVREQVQYDICHLEGSINLPFSSFQGKAKEVWPEWISKNFREDTPIYVMCRLGNDSQVVAKKLKDAGLDGDGKRYIGDIKGGFKAWREQIDSSWPEY